MGRFKDLTGQVFGRLTVLQQQGRNIQGRIMWLCECSCPGAKVILTTSSNLITGNTSSCGCYNIQCIKERRTTHGSTTSGKPTKYYRVWSHCKSRCYDHNDPRYHNYGGRGITMCSFWIKDAGAFVKYIQGLPGSDNPNLSLDRIDNNGNYCPGNLRWATMSQQINNKCISLTKEQREGIKDKLKSTFWTHSKIAKYFHVCRSTVTSISSSLKVQV